MPNYSYTIDSSFQPFSMQEMLVPFSAYKDAFEKSEEAYNDLSDKSDKFKYLSETLPEGSKARKLYEGYASDLTKQAEDLAHNGLTMTNRRALTSLKRRYRGEIGRLMKADEAMDMERKLRQSLNAQDSSRLYATDNLNIDDFLDGNSPNLYSISGNELYTRGAAAGKAASSRVFSAGDEGSTLGGYFRDYVQKMGYNADTISKFREDMSTIPELQSVADSILEERGVNQNLTGANLQRARQSVINGMIDGAVYQEQHSPQRDLGVLTASEKVADQRAQQQFNLQRTQLDRQAASIGYRVDDNGNLVVDPERMKALQTLKTFGKSTDGTVSKLKKGLKITWNGDVSYSDSHGNTTEPYFRDEEEENDISTEELTDDGKTKPEGTIVDYQELPRFARDKVMKIIGPRGRLSDYVIYYNKYKHGIIDTEASVTLVPKDTEKGNLGDGLGMDYGATE